MASTICTLFEGNYHFGLAALINSLHLNGYKGPIWIGYRGELPPWAIHRIEEDEPGYQSLTVTDGLTLRFVPLATATHFAYYKPDFMRQILGHYCADSEGLIYFDPDITVQCRWDFFEEWLACGIALCEDRRSPVYQTSPQRIAWRRFFEPKGYQFRNLLDQYVNSGFIGVPRSDIRFLEEWQTVLQLLQPQIDQSNTILVRDPSYAFSIPDQDALNIALSTTRFNFSLMNTQAMGFAPGGFVMCHAIGTIKPWRKHMLLDALKGKIPMVLKADSEYIKHCDGPIRPYGRFQLCLRRIDRRLSTLVARLRGA